jgi:putative membrane protein
MTATAGPEGSNPDTTDASRRTSLAAERTWLAWWRTGLGATAVAVAVGRILPGLAGGARWPLRLLGLGYGILAVAILVIGALRQNRVAAALRRGDYDEISSPLVMWLTVTAVGLALVTLVVVAVAL